jgi:hypothetical protein
MATEIFLLTNILNNLFMKNKKNATPRSRNGSSKRCKLSSKEIAELNKDPLVQKLTELCRNNELILRLVEIYHNYGDKISIRAINLEQIRRIYSVYSNLLSLKCKFFIDSDGIIRYQFDSDESFEYSNEHVVVVILGALAPLGLNLEYLESQNSIFKGLNSFLLKEFPETYNAYCALSNQFKFGHVVQSFEKPSPTEDNVILDSNNKKKSSELLELDETLEEKKIFINHSLEEIDNEMVSNFQYSFLLIIKGLGCKIKNENNESHQIDDILRSFSNLMGSKCKYRIASDGDICFKWKDNQEFEESSESGIVILLGILACFKINLEFLEYQNPTLKGLNEFLLQDYPETYNAYCALTNQFKFDGTVKLGLNLPLSAEEVLSYWLNMKVEKGNNELLELKNNPKVENVCKDSSTSKTKGSDAVISQSSKGGYKKPLRKNTSLQKTNRKKVQGIIKNKI